MVRGGGRGRLLPALAGVLAGAGCFVGGATAVSVAEQDDAAHARRREAMVREQIEARGVRDAAVLAAMRAVPRHLFVEPGDRAVAYGDHPLPIGAGQTISQPYVVAFMTEALELRPGDKVLEIGTGSGYQAAVLAKTVRAVFSIEIVPELAKRAAATLEALGYRNVRVRAGDGYAGWPEEAPFDAIMITAACPRLPEPLPAQLAEGGRLVAPVDEGLWQNLLLARKSGGKVSTREILPVRFVPMTGKVRERP